MLGVWNPLGWIVLGLGGLLGLIGMVESVWNLFDSDYKKSQQRKEVDNALKQVCEKIAEDVKSQIESCKKRCIGNN
ncbi:GTPase [Helicobacter acinonychis]|uniref:MADF domain-containing protein n=1 Tax=Helicobacter acinonychis (strain Sheeba) TaxID=382638 RepID=Q17XY3_HELAH|nr:hypothetical protein fragment 4 [Helicobacter acinonychis str. Sheeba]STP04066.1 GTPase [Helicobacter acinonychis]